MATPRNGVYIWVTWLSKVMAGEQSCEWASWFKAHMSYERRPSDFDVAAWTVDHTRKLRELHIQRKRLGELVSVEAENSIKYQAENGVTLAGKPDLIASAGGIVTIYDVKTGQPKTSDIVQLTIYMHLVPQVLPKFTGTKPLGCLVYNSDRVTIPNTAVDQKFVANFEYFLGIVGGAEEALRVPAENECRFCDIPVTECRDRFSNIPTASSESA